MMSARFVELMIDLKHFMLVKHPGQNFLQDKVFLPISFGTALKFNDALREGNVFRNQRVFLFLERINLLVEFNKDFLVARNAIL